MYRVAFDPNLPVVAASPFTAAGVAYASKDPVDWRTLGITEQVLRDWWQAGLVTFVEPQAPVSANEANETLPTIAESPTVPHVLYDGATSVDTSKLTRAERRALKRQG